MTVTAQRAARFETAEQHKLYVALAHNAQEVREAQRLRYRVFVEEMGARLECEQPGIESDRLDPFCHHLLVRNSVTQEVVGCYRILTNTQAIKAGGYYSQQEFDLGPVLRLPGRFMEVGRTCVHPDYRSGAVISLLWAGLARFMVLNKFDYLMGCASIPLSIGLDQVAGIWSALSAKHLTPPEWRVYPKKTLPGFEQFDAPAAAEIPPLVKGYMRLGAEIGGAPHWDEQFNVADLFILLSIRRLNQRYARHFLSRA